MTEVVVVDFPKTVYRNSSSALLEDDAEGNPKYPCMCNHEDGIDETSDYFFCVTKMGDGVEYVEASAVETVVNALVKMICIEIFKQETYRLIDELRS